MWYLVEDSPPPEEIPAPKYWLGGVNSGERLIGRKNVHIRIKAASVSRAHATVRVVPAAFYTLSTREPPHIRSTAVILEDSSAYGTYVKYPPGHASNRVGVIEGYHSRLDKNVPTEIREGALLAFGAPTAWWRLVWQNILCYASALSQQQSENLSFVVKVSGLQVASDFSADITHFVVEQYKTANMKFLSALVRGIHVVTPAWLNSVQHTVQESCPLITETLMNAAPLAACKLPDEQQFLPTFSEDDKSNFPSDVLESTFTENATEKRSEVFKNRTFGFPREEARAKWAPVLERMGASALLSTSPRAKKFDVVHVGVSEAPRRKRSLSYLDSSNDKITEQALISAILSGDESHIAIPTLQSRSREDFEDESDVDGDEATDVDDDVANLPKSRGVRGANRENAKEKPSKRSPGEIKKKARKVRGDDSCRPENDANSGECIEMHHLNGDANERAFFDAETNGSNSLSKRTCVASEHDVRHFKRRRLPRLSKLELKRA